MADPDDHTLVGEQRWQDYGSQELIAHPIAQTQPTLLDPQTARAVRAACWAVCVAVWLFILITVIVLAGLFVGVVNGTPGS